MLLITLDTTRADHLGCYGDASASTPNLDALARQGVRFERALSPAPLTLPSHTTLLTARVPRRHGVRDNAGFRLRRDVPVLAERFRVAGYRTAAFVSAAVLDRVTGLDRGFETYDDTVRVGARSEFRREERAAEATTAAVLERLNDLEPPFFLWVHYYDPHLPYVPPEPFRGRFAGRPYDGEIAYMDRQVGRLLKAVRARTPRLLVVAAGDHGESLGEHGEEGHGVFVYQATQRVPLLVAGPGVPGGRVVARTVGLVDVAPTVLDLLHLPPLPGADGASLVPELGGDRETAAAPEYEMESFFPFFSYGWAPPRALVRGRWKYVELPRPELYDLARDPTERYDVRRKHARAAREMAEALDRRVRGDRPVPSGDDPALAELRRRIESLGYVGGGAGGEVREPVDPKDGIAWIADLEAGRRALQRGDAAAGIAPLERLLARNPENVPALLTLAECRLATGAADTAEALSRRALDVNPANVTARFHLANALAEKARSDPAQAGAARAEYEKVLEANPRFADAYLNYAALLARAGKMDAVLALLRRAREAGMEDPDIETELGRLLLVRGDTAEAREALERALALYPGDADALEGLGRIEYDAGNFARSAEMYGRALQTRPSAALARTLGSIRLYALKDRRGALEAYRRALELSPPGDPARADLLDLIRELESNRNPGG